MILPISVVLCSYNGARFIEEQVQSVLAQTYPVQELIVVDDASSDNTCAIIEQLAAKDGRIRLYRNPVNLGFSANFEKALLLAGADIIAIADQDDYWHPAKLEKMMQQWHENIPLIYCDSVRFKEVLPVNPVPNPKNNKLQGDDPKCIAMFNTISGHAMLIRKSLLAKALPIPSNVYYDWWLAMVAMCNGSVQFLPEILVYQRAHDQNVTIQQLTEKELRNQFRQMLVKHLEVFSTVKGMKPSNVRFFQQLEYYWKEMLRRGWSLGLFLFLLKHRNILFAYKKRKLPFISQLKHSFLFAFGR
jgi:glycosyltransferase involved in cell wall biosynthesis